MVPSDLSIGTPWDGAEVTVNTDLVPTDIFVAGHATVIQTPQDRIKIQPTGNIIKIFRNGTLETQLASNPASGHHWIDPQIVVLEIRPDRASCSGSAYWEVVGVDHDPGTLTPPDPMDLNVSGWWAQRSEQMQFESGEDRTAMRNGPTSTDEKTANPIVLEGNDTWTWHELNNSEPAWVDYSYNLTGDEQDTAAEQLNETVYDDQDGTWYEHDPNDESHQDDPDIC